MEPIQLIASIVTPLNKKNVDTDQIISKEFLKRIERTGFGKYLFYHWRYQEDGAENPSFVLNDPTYSDSRTLVAHENFGCGSSREHAPWAIGDYGFRVVIAPSFADIFYNNCMKNGILPIRLPVAEVEEILAKPYYTLTVDLPNQQLLGTDGVMYNFSIDPYQKKMLLNGWDEISLTFQYDKQIKEYEAKHFKMTAI